MVAAAGNDRERLAADRELSRLFHARTLCVSEIVEPIDHLPLRNPLAAVERQGAREDARIRPVELAVHPRIDHAREDPVVVPEGGGSRQDRNRDGK